MNKPIQRVSVAVILMIVALLANATYVQVFKANSLRSDPRNNRVLLDEYARQRGSISAGGSVVAVSTPSPDSRLKFLRSYPPNQATAFAPVTGYYSFQYGSTGLEMHENSILDGNDDRLFGQRFMDMFSGRQPRGGNVVTTINPKLQQVAFNQLRHGCRGGCRGAVVALQPNTGKILALASSPSYDPNKLASHNQAVREHSWAAWNQPNDINAPMLDRALNQLYPAGSTFKVITTAAALRDGVTPDLRLTSAPSIRLPNTNVQLSNYGGESCPDASDGTVSLTQAFKYSCNTAFVDMTTSKMRDPITVFRESAQRFGLGDKQPDTPLPVSRPTLGAIPDLAALGQSAIGQRDVRVTPMQMAMVAETVANGGVRMQPYLVDKLQAADLRTLQTTQPTTINEPISSDQAATLTSLMIESERNTEGGGGPLSIASKTGTAEHSNSSDVQSATPYSWYIAFGPSSNAQIAVAVVVENGDPGPASTGGKVAAPIGRAVINALVGGAGG